MYKHSDEILHTLTRLCAALCTHACVHVHMCARISVHICEYVMLDIETLRDMNADLNMRLCTSIATKCFAHSNISARVCVHVHVSVCASLQPPESATPGAEMMQRQTSSNRCTSTSVPPGPCKQMISCITNPAVPKYC